MIYYKSWCSPCYFFNILFLDIVNLYFIIFPAFRIISCQSTGLFKYPVWQNGLSIALYDHMGTGNAFGMEPPVISACYFKSKIFILIVIFSYENIVAVRRYIMERFTCDLWPLFIGTAFFYITKFHQLFFDLDQIIFL